MVNRIVSTIVKKLLGMEIVIAQIMEVHAKNIPVLIVV